MELLTDDEDFLDIVFMFAFPRRPQIFRDRPDHFQKWNESEFIQRFRLSKDTVRFVINEIADDIASPTNRNHALSPAEMVFVTLRFLATGSFLQVTGDFNGIDKSTASRVIHKVVTAIARKRREYISMPNTEEEIRQVRQKFYNISGFPRCIGALDCTHIRIQSPGGAEAENYRNRKGFFSLNVQAVCDSELQIQNIVCRWPGASHDSNIFRHSRLRAKFERGEFGENLLLGDSGYGIKRYLITPLLNPRTPAEHLFNESQIRTRNPIERCFGVLKRRFPILAYGVRIKLNKVEAVVITCTILHNIACARHDAVPPVNDEIEAAINFVDIPNVPARQNRLGINDSVRHALITDYFQNLL